MSRDATRWHRLAFLAVALAGGAIVARSLGLPDAVRADIVPRLREWIASYGPWSPAVFIVGYALAELLFVPALPLTILGGAAFGPLRGAAYVSVGATLGAAMAFLAARYAARGMVERWVEASPRLRRIDAAVARDGWRILMVTRLVPLFPFNLQNFAYGLTCMRFSTFVLISWPCMLPGTLAYTLAGGALSEVGGDASRALAYVGLGGALMVLLSLLSRWLRRRRLVGAELLQAR